MATSIRVTCLKSSPWNTAYVRCVGCGEGQDQSPVYDCFLKTRGHLWEKRGYIDLDEPDCADALNGYMDYLTNKPNFSLIILDDLNALHGNNCWHIKRSGHGSINNWQSHEPVMIYSDQLTLLREFQERFDKLWEQRAGAVASRANVISILREVVGRTKKARAGGEGVMGFDCLIHGHGWPEKRCTKYGKKLKWKKRSLADLICGKKDHRWTGC